MQPPSNTASLLKSNTFIIIVFTFLTFLLRIHYINTTEIVDLLNGDAGQYVDYAYNLAHHNTFSKEASLTPTPDSFRSPGFPLLMAASFIIGGNNFELWTIFFQALLSSLLIPLTYLLARLFLPRWGVFLTMLLVALSPHLITMTSYLLSETLFSFTILAAFTCYVYACKQEILLLFILAGLLFGFSYLTNEASLFVPPILALVTYISLQNETSITADFQRLKRLMIVGVLVFLIFPTGWLLRNTLNVPASSPNSTGRALATLSHGAYPDFIYNDPAYKYFPYMDDPEQLEFSSSLKSFRRIFWRRFKERPLRYISWYLLEKPYHLWTWKMTQGTGDLYVYEVSESLFTKSAIANYLKTLMEILHYSWMVLCVLGFFALFRRANKSSRNLPVVLIFTVIIYVTVVYTIFAPWSRYAVPFRPFFYGMGTWTLWFFLSRMNTGTGVMSGDTGPAIPKQIA